MDVDVVELVDDDVVEDVDSTGGHDGSDELGGGGVLAPSTLKCSDDV